MVTRLMIPSSGSGSEGARNKDERGEEQSLCPLTLTLIPMKVNGVCSMY